MSVIYSVGDKSNIENLARDLKRAYQRLTLACNSIGGRPDNKDAPALAVLREVLECLDLLAVEADRLAGGWPKVSVEPGLYLQLESRCAKAGLEWPVETIVQALTYKAIKDVLQKGKKQSLVQTWNAFCRIMDKAQSKRKV